MIIVGVIQPSVNSFFGLALLMKKKYEELRLFELLCIEQNNHTWQIFYPNDRWVGWSNNILQVVEIELSSNFCEGEYVEKTTFQTHDEHYEFLVLSLDS